MKRGSVLRGVLAGMAVLGVSLLAHAGLSGISPVSMEASQVPLPEPSTIMLLLVPAAVLWQIRRRR